MAGFELYLAQYDVEKSVTQIDYFVEQIERNPEKNAAGSLWAMAAIAARGIDRERVFDEIIIATESDNDKVRRGAVEALARFGGQEIIQPLLQIARYDSSSYIQERAFCGLAQTGTLQVIERYDALPGLLQTLRDPYTTQQQKGWVYQALKEISTFYDVTENPDEWEERLLDVDMLKL
jgi:HEAT repeat protein